VDGRRRDFFRGFTGRIPNTSEEAPPENECESEPPEEQIPENHLRLDGFSPSQK